MMREVTTKTTDALEHYDPEQGLKSIAVAEAAEKHYARARNIEKLCKAVEHKLGEQRKFVLWWDGQEKAQGGEQYHKSPSTRSSAATSAVAGKQGIPDRYVIQRWRDKLKDPKSFDLTLSSASDRCVKICEASKGQTDQRGASGTGENEWYTPEQYIAAARDVLGEIDLDPASNEKAQKTIGATTFYTKQDDGLSQDWHGRVWLNPPYAQPYIAEFVSKMVSEVESRRVTDAIMLTHNYTDTSWFHEAATACSAICFTRGRVKFLDQHDAPAAPTQGQAFFYFGPDASAFRHRFVGIGFIVKPLRA